MSDKQVDYRKDLTGADKVAADAKSMASAAKQAAADAAELAASVDKTLKSAALVWEYYVTITQTVPVSLALSGVRLSATAAKAKVGDLVFVHPAGRPTVGALTLGFCSVQDHGFVNADGSVDVNCVLPAISVGGTLSIPLRLRGFRPPAA